MPTIVFASSKGGAGKTTAALVLATQLAIKTSVTIIDADPNQPLARWASGGNCPDNLKIVSDLDEDSITDAIDAAAIDTTFVIVDLEGSAAQIVTRALETADFVIVPTQGSELDSIEAQKSVTLIKRQEKSFRRQNPAYSLPFSILLTRTNPAIRTRNMAFISGGMREAGLPVFQTELNEREAFKSMVGFKAPLSALSEADVPGVSKAIINAQLFTDEVVTVLKALRAKTSEVAT